MFEASLIPARDGSVAMGSRASGFRVRIALLAAVLALAAVGLGMAPASAHATTTCTAFNGAWNEQWYNPCSNPVNYWEPRARADQDSVFVPDRLPRAVRQWRPELPARLRRLGALGQSASRRRALAVRHRTRRLRVVGAIIDRGPLAMVVFGLLLS